MSITRCSHCTFLITPDEVAAGQCPSCRTQFQGAAGLVAAPAPEPLLAASSAPCPRLGPAHWVPTAALAVLGLFAGALCVGFLRPLGEAAPGDRPQEAPPNVSAGPERTTNPGSAAPTEVHAPPGPPPAALASHRPAGPAEGPAPRNLPAVPPAEIVRTIDQPGLPYVVESLTQGGQLRLVGTSRTLIVGRVSGASTLDASQLGAKKIICSDQIDGRSTVKLNAPGGVVEVRSKLDDWASLEVYAPNGTVTFTEPTRLAVEGSEIGGGADIHITAKVVEFRGIVGGARTKVSVTLTRDGALKFQKLADGAYLEYRKADPADPEPRVERGTVTGLAELNKRE
jgi:hypothetical protein